MNKVDISLDIESGKECVSLRIPIQDLIDAQEDRPDISFEVLDKEKMIELLIEHLENLNLSEWLDMFFEMHYSSGDAWLKGNWSLNPVFPK